MNFDMERVAMQDKCAIVALTEAGKETALSLQEKWSLPCQVYTLARLADGDVLPLTGSPIQAIADLFKQVDLLVCIMATGIVVRAIAPVLQDKVADPAVIVMDEKGSNVISLLSGHLGGANEATQIIADLLGAHPVITTATDVQNVVALDSLAKSVNGWRADLRLLVKVFNGLLASGKPVYFYQEKNWIEDTRGLSVVAKEDLRQVLASKKPLILLQIEPPIKPSNQVAWIQPKPYVLGVGARKNVATEIFQEGFRLFCQQAGILPAEIAKIVSIDVKKEEPAIQALVRELSCPFETFTRQELETVADRYPCSDFVRQTVGVGSVALASADLASGGQVITERFARQGCTYALARLGGTSYRL